MKILDPRKDVEDRCDNLCGQHYGQGHGDGFNKVQRQVADEIVEVSADELWEWMLEWYRDEPVSAAERSARTAAGDESPS